MEHIISDEDILQGLGIAVDSSSATAQQVVAGIRTAAATRFSEVIADLLTEEQLQEFETKKATQSFAEVQTWLEDIVPEFQALQKAAYQDVLEEYKTRLDTMLDEK